MTDVKQVSVFTVTIKQIMSVSVLMTDEKQVSVFTVTIKQIMVCSHDGRKTGECIYCHDQTNNVCSHDGRKTGECIYCHNQTNNMIR